MSDLLSRLRALRGESVAPDTTPPGRHGADYAGAAAQLGATAVRDAAGVHLLRRTTLPAGARHGRAPLGEEGLGPLMRRWAEAAHRRAVSRRGADPAAARGANEDRRHGGRVLYLDTETTGLAGGTGTYAFLIGVGVHEGETFTVTQIFLPGPQHEASQLEAFETLARGADAVVSYNGAGFDLPLLRNRFVLHGRADPLAQALSVDLLPLARRLWRERLVDCTLGTVERDVLRARRDHRDVPGREVPERYAAYLASLDAGPLKGVLRHNQDDVVALAALRHRVEALLESRWPAAPDEAHALGRLLSGLGEDGPALDQLRAAARHRDGAAWDASSLLRRTGRREEARALWDELAKRGHGPAWVELAKDHEHRTGDLQAALAAVQAARACAVAPRDDLDKREARLRARLRARDG